MSGNVPRSKVTAAQQHDVMCCVKVRVDAVAALRNLVEAFDDDHLDSIKPLLPELLNLLFALMVEVMAAPCRPCQCCRVPGLIIGVCDHELAPSLISRAMRDWRS